MAFIEAPRNARRNSRTSTSITGEQKKAELANPRARPIGFSISYKPSKINLRLRPRPTLLPLINQGRNPQLQWQCQTLLLFLQFLTSIVLVLTVLILFHQLHHTKALQHQQSLARYSLQQTLQYSHHRRNKTLLLTTSITRPLHLSRLLHFRAYHPPTSCRIRHLRQPHPTKKWKVVPRGRGSGRTSSRP